MGCVLIEERCLSRIFAHSYKIKPASQTDVDTICSAALTWRCNQWCDSNYNVTRHHPGRPRARWSDVFVKFGGSDWYVAVCDDLVKWKTQKRSFIQFVLKYKKPTNVEVKLVDESVFCKQPRNISDVCHDMPWEPLNDKAFAIELCGDSLLVVNWLNAVRPCYSDFYTKPIAESQRLLHDWLSVGGRPRKRHLNWCRHVPRELNTDADGLAIRGKALEGEKLVVDILERPNLQNKVFLKGFWDGSYKPGDLFCGIGARIDLCEHVSQTRGGNWKIAAQAFGKRQGRSAVSAEVQASSLLLDLMLD